MTGGQIQDPFLPAQHYQFLLYIRAAVPGPDSPVQFLLQSLDPERGGCGSGSHIFQLQGNGTERFRGLPQALCRCFPDLLLPGRDRRRGVRLAPVQTVSDTYSRGRAGSRQQEEQVSLKDRNQADQQQEQAKERQGRRQAAAGIIPAGDRRGSGNSLRCRSRRSFRLHPAQGGGQCFSAGLQDRAGPFPFPDFVQQLPVRFFQVCLPRRGSGQPGEFLFQTADPAGGPARTQTAPLSVQDVQGGFIIGQVIRVREGGPYAGLDTGRRRGISGGTGGKDRIAEGFPVDAEDFPAQVR